jgi:L-ornithine N5-oxygenase
MNEYRNVVGVGFGPANLALAVALDEAADGPSGLFLERQAQFGWHRNMLLPFAKMQVAFVKDLVTFRNPGSAYTFISYLHHAGRLVRFVNNQDFFPTRLEFHDYLEWVAGHFTDRTRYGAEVRAIRPAADGSRGPLEVEFGRPGEAGSEMVNTDNVVISTGLVPRMPPGVEMGERVWHSSQFLGRFRARDWSGARRLAVVGGGQSAAELTTFLYDNTDAEIISVVPSYGYSIADNTPFANEVFDPVAVDDYYFGSKESQDAYWRYHRNTNYSVVDDDLLRDLYRRSYDDDFSGARRLKFLRLSRIDGVEQDADAARLLVRSLSTGERTSYDVDAVAFATGYHPMSPDRLLTGLDQHLVRDEHGAYRVDRDHRLVTTGGFPGGIYVQGGTEQTHGLSASLLSNMAVRSGEIVESITKHTTDGWSWAASGTEAVAVGS